MWHFKGKRRQQHDDDDPDGATSESLALAKTGTACAEHDVSAGRVFHGACFLAPGSLARRRLARVIHHRHHGASAAPPGRHAGRRPR